MRFMYQYHVFLCFYGPEYLRLYSHSLLAGWSGNLIPVRTRFFLTRTDRPRDPTSPLYNGYRLISGGKATWAWG